MLHVKAGFALSRSIVAHVSEYYAFVCRYLAATPSRREAAMAESAVFGNASRLTELPPRIFAICFSVSR